MYGNSQQFDQTTGKDYTQVVESTVLYYTLLLVLTTSKYCTTTTSALSVRTLFLIVSSLLMLSALSPLAPLPSSSSPSSDYSQFVMKCQWGFAETALESWMEARRYQHLLLYQHLSTVLY
jgi:hypothetical protein